jgi:formylglycine-generating enzyme required for sulfatase activity
MKYEITQGQYMDFLNTLPEVQAATRYPNFNGSNMFDIGFTGSYYTNNKDRVCNYLSINDILSYLDFAALRPITELEFEKACRGKVMYIEEEFVFGTEVLDSLIETLKVLGFTAGTEVINDNPKSNTHYNETTTSIEGGIFSTGTVGPVAAGIYARTTPKTRIRTGATFFGVMEMGGNVSEICVQAHINTIPNGASDPSQYTGIWGDGSLTVGALYNTTGWPVNVNIIRRGGSLVDGAQQMRVSDRSNLNYTNYNERLFHYGGRGAR